MKNIIITFLLFAGLGSAAQIIPTTTTVSPASTQPVNLPLPYNSAAKINYVRTWEPWRPVTDETLVPTLPVAEVKQTTAYVDGLGRTIQTVSKQTSPLGKDIINYTVLDQYGRPELQYLPYASPGTDGYFKTNPFYEQRNYYNTPALNNNQYIGEKFYYGKTQFEEAPLGRTVKTMTPGNAWTGSNRGVGQEYWNNAMADAVRIWTVAATAGSIPITNTTYQAGRLYKLITVDEHGKKVIEYKAKSGKVILKKVQLSDNPGAAHSGWLCTYYIYDDFEQLRCVIQPQAVQLMVGTSEDGGFAANWTLTSTLLNEQCFRYEYDYRDRMISKKIPGAGEVYMVYDALDRLVMTQDANLRNEGKWLVTQYDNLNRPVSTGLLTSSSNRTTHQAAALASISYPASVGDELTHTWYDDYTYSGSKGFDNTDLSKLGAGGNPYPETLQKSDLVYGKVTGTKTKVLGTSQYLISTIYYDEDGRTIQILSDNYAGGIDIITTRYDFGGKVLASYVKQTNPLAIPSSTRVLTKMFYDAGGRVIKIWKKLNDNNDDKLIAENSYDELGQLKSKKLAPNFNNNTGLESLNYKYTICGWIESMNKDYVEATNSTHWFGQALSYDIGFSKQQYNGNISGAKWRSKGDGEQRAYGYDYDGANRLLKADFTQNNSGWNTTAGIDFSVKMGDGTNPTSAYDANGNILRMQQWGLKIAGSQQIDDMLYTYYDASNKLKAVTEQNSGAVDHKLEDFTDKNTSATDYGYDVNGNMITDLNKDITGTTGIDLSAGGAISYNHLNLPRLITVAGKGTIAYTYDAAGNKLRKVTTDNTVSPARVITTDYVAGMVYENNTLQFTGMEEGRIRYKAATGQTAASFQYDYFIKDHLDNVRMVLTEEQIIDKYPVASLEDAKVATEDDYYTIDNSKIITASSLSQPPPAYTNDNGIGNNPADASFEAANSTKLYKLNANTNKTGLGITLKVMAGDRIDIHGTSYWYQNTGNSGPNVAPAVIDLLTGLLGSPASAAGGKATALQLDGIGNVNTPLGAFIDNTNRNDPSAPNRPKAFINYIFLDEQFKMAGGGFSAVSPTAGLKNAQQHFADLQNKIAPENGYLYIYVSNESPVDVFFDNLQVVHTRGPLLEETHYYPFGLKMTGISSKALIFGDPKNKENTFQNQRFDDELGLSWFQFKWRNHDPQIGRFIEIDPLADKYTYNSTYSFSENCVTSHNELEGLEKTYTSPKQMLYEGGGEIAKAMAKLVDRVGMFLTINPSKESPTSMNDVKKVTTFEFKATVNLNVSSFIGYVESNGSSKGYTGSIVTGELGFQVKEELKKEIAAIPGLLTVSSKVGTNGNSEFNTEVNIPGTSYTMSVSGSNNPESSENKLKATFGYKAKDTKTQIVVEIVDTKAATNIKVGFDISQKVGNWKFAANAGFKF